jgi:hypothetical protein
MAAPVTLQPNVPQLFIDDELIEQQTHLRRTLNCPKKDDGGEKPLLAIDNEFGDTPATLEANGTILFDPQLHKYVMFALGFASSAPADRVKLFRFTSADGMKWVKGDNGMPQRIAIDLSDPKGGAPATNIDLFSCYYDSRDKQMPYKGWVWLANFAQEGIWSLQSADGKAWERGRLIAPVGARKITQDGRTLAGPSDVSIIYQEPASQRLLALLKFTSTTKVNESSLRSRAYMFVDRWDEPLKLDQLSRVALVPAAEDRNGDLPADEYYASTAWRYGSLWLGGLKVWHRSGDYPYSAAGCAFLKFAVSRDGLDWHKVQFENDHGQREVLIPNGKEGGNDGHNDGGYITEFSQGPLHIGNELIYYYGCSSWGKNHPPGRRVTGGGIFRARLREDGFVSVDGGILTTKPLETRGRRMRVNSSGSITVKVLDLKGDVLATSQLNGDNIAHSVQLPDHSPLRLRFTIGDGGHLYSFTIAD